MEQENRKDGGTAMDAALIKVLREIAAELKAIRKELRNRPATAPLEDLESYFESREDDGK